MCKEKIKGEKNGLCNRTDCQSPEHVIWFNHSTRKYYCTDCAAMLNDDPYNARDAQRLYGHDLCTREGDDKQDIREYIEQMSDEDYDAIIEEVKDYEPVTILLPDKYGNWVDPMEEILGEQNNTQQVWCYEI